MLMIGVMPLPALMNNVFSGNAIDQTYEVDLPNGVFGSDYIRRPNDLSWRELLRRRDEVRVEAAQANDAIGLPPPDNLPDAKKKEWEAALKYMSAAKKRERNAIEMRGPVPACGKTM